MNEQKIIDALVEQFEVERHYVEVGLAHAPSDKSKRSNIVWYAIQRCMGMIELAQQLGLPYDTAEPMFEGFKEILYDLEKTP